MRLSQWKFGQRTVDWRPRRKVVSRRAAMAAAWVLGTATAARAQQPVAAPPVERADSAGAMALAFQGVTVIDVRTGRHLPNQTIVVVGNRIRAVGPARRVHLPAGTRVLRADGTFAIPGLWDMHVHVFGFPNTFFALFLANGVTGVRDMGSPFLDSMLLWRREIMAGRRVGPRLVTAGPIITGRVSLNTPNTQEESVREPSVPLAMRNNVGAATPEEGRRLVDSLQQVGVDFIKVYQGLKPDVYFAVVREARRVGVPVGGHLTGSVSAMEASDSGVHSIEHGMGLEVCDTDSLGGARRCRELAAHLRRNDTWVGIGSPILCESCHLPWYREQSRYKPDSLFDPFNRWPGRHGPEPQVFSTSLERWADLHRGTPPFRTYQQAGVPFILGTDAAAYGLTSVFIPGFAVHGGLSSVVHGGFSPLQALQAATLNPAKYFHATDSMGIVAPGKVADLVFLDADPLVDIFNTRRIRAVVANGRFYDRPALDSLLLGAERLAQQSRRP